MAVLEALSDEEAYLYAILSDPSGLDQAEFVFKNPEEDDYCWRAWPFQWRWYRNEHPLQIDQCSRSVGKSLSIKVRAFCFPFIHPGQEMVITAPEGVHLDAITDLVEQTWTSIRLGKEMMLGNRSGIKHRPFHMSFRNGARIMGRIPQRDGKGVKGIHPIWLELDEAQDYPDAGWTELIETLKRGHEGAVWRAHGVTRGVRDHFYKYTQPDSGWSVNRYTAMHRPTWTDQERQEKIEQYGSREHPDYRRNILGAHGDATNPLFVLHRLMGCVDTDETSDYNCVEYCNIRLNYEMVMDIGQPITSFLQFPESHRQYKRTWIGMDVGYTNHPSEILVFAEEKQGTKKESVMKLVTRVHLERIGHGDQVTTILYMLDWYNAVVFAMDKTGLGLPLFQAIQEQAERDSRYAKHLNKIKGYNFSSKILVDFDQTIEVDQFFGDPTEEAGIERNVLEYASDRLRDLVDHQRLVLPWDRDLIGEFQGQTYVVKRDTMNLYGKKVFSQGKFHALDAARMAVLGWAQYAIEDFVKQKDTRPPVIDVFFA